jgi:UDP-N-acetylmuramyl tripeptide synthase
MTKKHITLLGKAIRHAAALRGGGSALPGLVIEKLDPDFLARTLRQLPEGVVVISGTNGKTTTTKMVVSLLESQGLRVFTNRTGSNFTRGVVAALLGAVNLEGALDADIAVLELDEAHAVHFVKAMPPRYCLLLNVMRDQLDRFGEIDKTAQLLEKIARATTEGVVLNREDPRVRHIGDKLPQTIKKRYFGLGKNTRALFPNDDETHRKERSSSPSNLPSNVTLESFIEHTATFTIEGKEVTTTLQITGVYNVFNAAAALALVTLIRPKRDDKKLITALSSVTPAFGRGETIMLNGNPLELVLVKNPAGFRLALQSFAATNTATMIAINDSYADGRDMSWLWDVDFKSLKENGVAMISGVRAYDMALRLQYDGVEMTHISTNLKAALTQFLDTHPEKPKRIFCTYTAMLALRQQLKKVTEVERIS